MDSCTYLMRCNQSIWQFFAFIFYSASIFGAREELMLRYRLEGNGMPLLLIHGWGVTYAIWQNLAPLLKPHFQLIMIELPGIGDSPEPPADLPYYQVCAEAIEEVRIALGIERWAVLSYSSGTRAAEAYVQRYAQ